MPALAAASLLTSPAGAAEQGAFGAMSKGGIGITLSIAARAMLAEAVSVPVSGDPHHACLWLGTATHGYAVTALDAPVVWQASASAKRATLAAGATLADQSSPAARPDCDRDPALLVGYAAAEGGSAPATLLIAPE